MTSTKIRFTRYAGNRADPDHQRLICETKDGFDSPALAKKVAKRMIRSGKDHRGVTVYRCGHCRKFHIGSRSWN